MNYSEIVWRSIFSDLLTRGSTVETRGMKVVELLNYQFAMPSDPFMSFKARGLNLDYIRREFQWYLKGDRYDLSICKHAKIWNDHVCDGTYLNSNYGHYLFARRGLINAVEELRKDPYSRRACISILNTQQHLGAKDIPCTYAINFMIRDDKLHMTVRMRSNDLFFGLGNDAPIFHFIHQLAFWMLSITYPNLTLGSYTHSADSFHIYERHIAKGQEIAFGDDPYTPVGVPKIGSVEEALAVMHDWSGEHRLGFAFYNWLWEVKL